MKRLRLFFEFHWIKIVVVLILIAAIAWPAITLSEMDVNQANYLIAVLSMAPIQAILSAAFFVMFLYWLHYGGLSFNKLNKDAIDGKTVNVHWNQVIGMEEAKQEAWEVVELLKDHTKVSSIGGKVLRGLLLLGPPGCGKTYLAKAIATESKLPFLAISGSEFIEVFVGTGPARVRKIFKKAQQLARAEGGCIIFIDELDAVGTSRGSDLGFGAQTERNNTINELLVQMDGLESMRHNIVVIGATNADESVLDQALLRPGRMDRKIYVGRPGLADREKLIEFYLSKVNAAPGIDIHRLACRTVYHSTAEIENMIKESALIAARNKSSVVTYKDISEALERIDLGFKVKQKLSLGERRRVAYHEAGHLIATYLLHPTDDVFKASIISRRGGVQGVVYHVPREELKLTSRERILANIQVSLAGFIAEKIKCGSTSDSVGSDFKHAMMLAKEMVWNLGMGPSGLIGNFEVLSSSWAFRGSASGDFLSDRTKEKLNDEMQVILQQCSLEVENLLRKEDVLLEKFTSELLSKDELEYDEIEKIFADFGKSRQKDIIAPG